MMMVVVMMMRRWHMWWRLTMMPARFVRLMMGEMGGRWRHIVTTVGQMGGMDLRMHAVVMGKMALRRLHHGGLNVGDELRHYIELKFIDTVVKHYTLLG
jgi:hypothetical protein